MLNSLFEQATGCHDQLICRCMIKTMKEPGYRRPLIFGCGDSPCGYMHMQLSTSCSAEPQLHWCLCNHSSWGCKPSLNMLGINDCCGIQVGQALSTGVCSSRSLSQTLDSLNTAVPGPQPSPEFLICATHLQAVLKAGQQKGGGGGETLIAHCSGSNTMVLVPRPSACLLMHTIIFRYPPKQPSRRLADAGHEPGQKSHAAAGWQPANREGWELS